MSELGDIRPRRAAASDETLESDDLIGLDDTAAEPGPSARRGGPADADAAANAAREEAAETETGSAGWASNSGDGLNPFARPGSDSAAQPILPPRDFEDPTETTLGGRHMGPVADGIPPVPRRSAVSSTSPPEAMTPPSDSAKAPVAWHQHHHRTISLWVIGTVVAALVIGLAVFAIRRAATPTETPGTPSASTTETTSAPPVPDLSEADLMTVADAEAIVPSAGWVVTKTATNRAEATARSACLTADTENVNPTVGLQRTIATSSPDKLAVLHQVQAFADEATAIALQKSRVAELAACNLVPARIVSSAAITGLADEVTQATVVYEEAQPQFHTVLLIRTGRVLTILDIARNAKPVGLAEAIAGVKRSLSSFCSRVAGTCPTTPKAVVAAPPATLPAGWLATADLPRLRPGAGQWTATEPADITTAGTGCENLTLATVSGPTARAQRTYLLTQDDTAPSTFGVDEMLFTFASPAEASAFATKLGTNLATCKQRLLTATVTEAKPISTQLPDGTASTSRSFTIKQTLSTSNELTYQLIVSVSGTRVTYLLATVTPAFQFSPAQLAELAVRASQRAAQA